MNVEEGIIIETNDALAKIKVGRHENCSACGACASAQNIVVIANNSVNAKVGERVKFTSSKKNMLTAAFMVFIFPLLFAALGAVFAYYCISEYIIETAVVFFLISLLFVKIYDTKKGKEMKSNAEIIEVI